MDRKKIELKQVPELIQRHLLQQQRSNQTMKEYCQQNGIAIMQFYGWRKRYGKRLFAMPESKKNRTAKSTVSFTPLGTLNTLQSRAALFDIRFPNGTSISIYQGITAESFAPFLSLLSR
jgi:transposase-like protein